MENFFAFGDALPAGVGFALFSREHIAAMLACAGVCAGLCLAFCHAGTEGRKRLRLAVGGAILLCEILAKGYLILAGAYDLSYLPLHLCGLAVFFAFYHSLFPGETVGNFLYSTCMPGALFALLFPDWTAYPMLSYRSVVGFAVHALIAAYPLMQVLGGELRPSVRYLPRCLGILACLALPVYGFDRLTGLNFMFLLRPAKGSPLEWFAALLGNPGYLLGYIPMIVLIWCLLYFPFTKRKSPERTA